MAADGMMIVNAVYHRAVVSGLAIGYSRLGKLVVGGAPPKLDLMPRDASMIVLNIALAVSTKEMLIKQGIIPADTMN